MTLKNKINLSIFILIVLNLCLILFLIYPLFKDIKTKASEVTSEKQKIAFLEERAKNLEKLKLKYEEIEPKLEKLDKVFIDPNMPIGFINFIEEIYKNPDILVKNPAFSEKIQTESWLILPYQVTFIGSFPNFLKFLEKLESSNFLIEVQNLNISRLTENELKSKDYEKFSVGDVKANISIKIYAQLAK